MFLNSHPCRVIKTPEIANLALLGFGDIFALLFDNRYLYIMDLRTESLISRWPLPEYRKSKRGSSFLAGEASWLNGLDGHNDTGLVFATSMPDHSIHLVLWKEHSWGHEPHRWLTLGPGLRVLSATSVAADCMNQSSHLMVSSRSAQSFISVCQGARARVGEGLFYGHILQHADGVHHWLHLYLVMLVRIRGCIWGSSFLNIGFKYRNSNRSLIC